MKIIKWLALLSAVFSASIYADISKIKDEDGTAVFRAQYENGFSLVMKSLPVDSPDETLSKLKVFKEKYVRWARVGKEEYYPLESGFKNGAWMAIIPPNHVLAQKETNTLKVDAAPNMTVLRIRPDKVTEVWAGIFLIHELTHLADLVFKVEPPNPARDQFLVGEARAYTLESRAVNLMSRGNFERQLDVTLKAWKIATPKALVGKLMTLSYEDIADLDGVIKSEIPKSNEEASLRLGFYAAALLVRYLDKTHADKDTILRSLNRLLLGAAWAEDPYKW